MNNTELLQSHLTGTYSKTLVVEHNVMQAAKIIKISNPKCLTTDYPKDRATNVHHAYIHVQKNTFMCIMQEGLLQQIAMAT